MMNKPIFALDIGTRSVTGIILKKEAEEYVILDYCIKEHDERSMLDGQIHDVVAVANVIRSVKKSLERRHGQLDEVCVAAAGRALKTVQATQEMSLNQQPITKEETIKFLELNAVQEAQTKLAGEHDGINYANYYCVGYSVLKYTLDGAEIGSLIDQNGEQAAVEIIATFLPKVVVESLIAALNRADLKMEALTLEPIAAIQVLIPESMRRLNVALIDIGAGTSDIALTRQGTIAAYGMVPLAGDEITEAISDHYLLDFPNAEETKRNIVNHQEDIVEDILGFESKITYDDLFQGISESVHKLSQALATEVIQLNKKAPQAVMLIGGGSLTPELAKLLAEKLHLPENRVAIRGIEAIQNLHKSDELPIGPDFVTPIGIAIAAKQNPIQYMSITINHKIIRMFEIKTLTIGDCLIQAGIELQKYYGKPGLASIITVNNQTITLPGEYGQPPIVKLNNKESHIETIVNQYDDITIEKGKDGAAAHVTIQELLGDIPNIDIYFNDKQYTLNPAFYVNEHIETNDYVIKDKDKITIKKITTIEDFLTYYNIDYESMSQHFSVYINEQKINLPAGKTQIFHNQKQAKVDDRLYHNDTIELKMAKKQTVQDVLDYLKKDYWHSITIHFNQQPVILKERKLTVRKQGTELDLETNVSLNDQLDIQERKTNAFIFQDVFRYIDLDLSQVRGNFQLYKNGELTTFHDPIQTGDHLEIIWN